MRERTARIGSAGKSFSVTGWKVGYVTAPPDMMKSIAKTHQFVTFTTPPNLQWGRRPACGSTTATIQVLAGDMQRKRDRLAGALADIGFDVLPAHGPTSSPPTSGARLQRHRRGLLPSTSRGGRGHRRAGKRLLLTSRSRRPGTLPASASANTTRPSMRRDRTPGRAFPPLKPP
jgi:hypothetical protein